MDLHAVIRDLLAEKQRLERTIAAMESLTSDGNQTSQDGHRKRGRKFMGEAERQQVSERMKRYWASRRKGS